MQQYPIIEKGDIYILFGIIAGGINYGSSGAFRGSGDLDRVGREGKYPERKIQSYR